MLGLPSPNIVGWPYRQSASVDMNGFASDTHESHDVSYAMFTYVL